MFADPLTSGLCSNNGLARERPPDPAQKISTLPFLSAKKPTFRGKFRQSCERAFFERRGFKPTVRPSTGWADDCVEAAVRHFDV
jgi:hypothetical protein